MNGFSEFLVRTGKQSSFQVEDLCDFPGGWASMKGGASRVDNRASRSSFRNYAQYQSMLPAGLWCQASDFSVHIKGPVVGHLLYYLPKAVEVFRTCPIHTSNILDPGLPIHDSPPSTYSRQHVS